MRIATAYLGLILLGTLLGAGCATTGPRGARWLPWNWFAPDHATRLEQVQGETAAAEQALKIEQLDWPGGTRHRAQRWVLFACVAVWLAIFAACGGGVA